MLPNIRLATTADFSRLDELERACPMAEDTTLFIYRHGDYTRVPVNMWACSLSGRDVKTELVPAGMRLYHDFTLT